MTNKKALKKKEPNRFNTFKNDLELNDTQKFISYLTENKLHFNNSDSQLMLLREIWTVVIDCDNHIEHSNTLGGQNSEFL
jgi:hypothetical protein